MKNLWSTTKVPVSVLKDAETIKAHEKTIKNLERTIKVLKEENSYLSSSFTEDNAKIFPPASGQKTIAEEKRDKDLGAVRVVLAHRVREEIIEKTLKGKMSVVIFVSGLIQLDEDILKNYTYADIMEPIIKSLREEGYQVDGSFTSLDYFMEVGYRVSWS